MGQVEDCILRRPRKIIKFRIDAKELDTVCIDCADFMNRTLC